MYDVVLLTLGRRRARRLRRLRRRCGRAGRTPTLRSGPGCRCWPARTRCAPGRPGGDGHRPLRRRDRRGASPARRPAPPGRPHLPDPDSKTRLVVATASDGAAARRRAPAGPAVRPGAEQAPGRPARRPHRARPAAARPYSRSIRPGRHAPGPGRAARAAPRPGGGGRRGAGRHARRLDLLRNDGGSVTLDGALLGGGRRRRPAAALARPGSRWTTRCSPTATNRCWPARSATPAGTRRWTACRC